jgi:RNA polymerase sigma-70 factor (ECF subfamily)
MDDGFEAVYARYGRQVHAFAARFTGDAGAAEEICQETFVRYLQHEGALKGRNGHVAPWLFRVAANLGVDRLRKMKPVALQDGDPLPVSPAAPVEPDDGERVRRAVTALAPDLRAAFLLRAHHGLTFPQMALVLDLSERGAKDRYRRARDLLAERLAPWFPERISHEH